MGVLSKLLGGGAADLVTAVGDAVDKVVTSDEDRKRLDIELARAEMAHDERIMEISNAGRAADLADVADSRANQGRVQEAAGGSWLSKNVHPILALSIVGLTFFMFWSMVFGRGAAILSGNPEMKDILIYILGALTTVATQVVSYFFGSSSGSAEKNRIFQAKP